MTRLFLCVAVLCSAFSGCRSHCGCSPRAGLRPIRLLHKKCFCGTCNTSAHHGTSTGNPHAHKALSRWRQRSNGDSSPEFVDGFQHAYYDLLKGGNGTVPPVTPETYCAVHNRTEHRQRRTNQWYTGYRAGMASAYADAVTQYHVAGISGPASGSQANIAASEVAPDPDEPANPPSTGVLQLPPPPETQPELVISPPTPASTLTGQRAPSTNVLLNVGYSSPPR